ncbi:hypothetical protein CXB51_022040 [Gossypium anomalum]|uniref:NET domain-containing protein n=1 Tax=Gossypium anomalum TaxID=47600 RepID=A0A8J5YDS1_9ROSI|nr:hypothetical protein CXB51_022040 [Gossypium anomalum]
MNFSLGQMGEDEIEIDINTLSHEILYKLYKLLDDYLLEKQKNQAKAESCEMEESLCIYLILWCLSFSFIQNATLLLNKSRFSNSSMHCKRNDQVDEVVDIVGSSYPPVAMEKWLTHRNSRCCSSSGSSGESGSSSSASLIAASTKGATIFSGANSSQMYEYGKNLALSFQTGSLDETIELVKQYRGIKRAEEFTEEKADIAIKSLRCLPQSDFRLRLEDMLMFNLERID